MAQQRLNVEAPIERLFAERWSTRAFNPGKPVSREQVSICLEAARWAPSCFGEEPWRLIVADRFAKDDCWQRVLAALAPKNQLWAKHAPLFIVAASEPEFSQNGQPNRWCEYDTGQAVMCLCLQATALGLASHQMGGFNADTLKDQLELPERLHVMSVVAVGYPGDADHLDPDFQAMEASPRSRMPIKDFTHAGKWGAAWMPPEALGWQARYEETPAEDLPWFHPDLDPDFAMALSRLGISEGTVLDLGCGPGTQAIALARSGFDVTAVDIAEAAIQGARQRAGEAGVAVRFIVGDVLSLDLDKHFDLILDRGVLHCFADKNQRRCYIEHIHEWLKPGGVLLLKCFSHRETREQGPPCRFSPDDLRTMFGKGFRITELFHTIFLSSRNDDPPQAIFAVIQRS
jgi:nitroreductase/SAM-dependent methyltransferase